MPPFFVAQALLDEAKAKGQMARAVHEGFLSEIQTLETDLAQLAQTDTNKPATLAGRLTAYRQVKAKVSMYADLLGMQQSDVLHQLQALHHRVAQLLAVEGAVQRPEVPCSVLGLARMRVSNSQPSTCGIRRSVTTSAGASDFNCSSASAPLQASATSIP